jgi:hypothetical protein
MTTKYEHEQSITILTHAYLFDTQRELEYYLVDENGR